MKSHPLQKFLLALLIAVSSQFAVAENGSSQLSQQLGALEAFSARFEQLVLNANNKTTEQSKGSMAFKRPGKFRWIYDTPYEQEIVSDGQTLWIYDKDLEQVSIKPVETGLNQAPIRLLDDPSGIKDEFNVEVLSDPTADAEFRLTPKLKDDESAGFQSLILVFKDKQLIGMTILDSFDQTSLLSFYDINSNPELEDSSFDFIPPQGVDVIRAAEQPD